MDLDIGRFRDPLNSRGQTTTTSEIVFDLHDILYLERDYVLSGFRGAADAAAPTLSASPEELFEHLRGLFEWDVRSDTFDLFLV